MSNSRRLRRQRTAQGLPDDFSDCAVCEALGRGDHGTALAAFHGLGTRCANCGARLRDVRDLAPEGEGWDPVYGGDCPRCNDVTGAV
jgi:bacterioferritin-associated ferredoxin